MSHIIPESELHESAQRPTREDADKLRLELDVARLRSALATEQAARGEHHKARLIEERLKFEALQELDEVRASLDTVTAERDSERGWRIDKERLLVTEMEKAEARVKELESVISLALGRFELVACHAALNRVARG